MADEWARAMANPDNMIVSDSLVGRLGPADGKAESSHDPFMQCTIISDDGQVVSGRTAGFNQTDDEWCVTFETTHATANSMLRFESLKEVVFSFPSEEEEVVWTVKEGEKVAKKTEFFGQNDALITITITLVKDDDDPNSYTVTMEAPSYE